MRSIRGAVVRTIARMAHPLGLSIIPTWRLQTLAQQEHMRRIFEDFRISGVLDVGANAGQFAQFIRNDIGFSGPILSVEPIPELAQSLKVKASNDPHWRIHHAAAGRESGYADLNATAGSEFSSLLPIRESSAQHFHGQTEIVARIRTEVTTLDVLIAQQREFLGERIYLKLDTQGFDLEALAGLSEHLRLVVAAQSETSVDPIYEGAPDAAQTFAAFKQSGFTMSGIFPNNAGHYPRLIEFDTHFVLLNPPS